MNSSGRYLSIGVAGGHLSNYFEQFVCLFAKSGGGSGEAIHPQGRGTFTLMRVVGVFKNFINVRLLGVVSKELRAILRLSCSRGKFVSNYLFVPLR